MHAIEKIFAKNSGLESVKSGQIVTAAVDTAEVNDLYLQTIYSFYEMGGERVWDTEKLAFVFDHYAPAPTIRSASNHKEMREFVRKQGIRWLFDVNCGVCHQVMPEKGLVRPGTIVVATDSHTTTHGAFGAVGMGVGATDMAAIMIAGKLWFRVPEIMEVRIEGTPRADVMPKDVILYILGQIKADGAVYKAIEFSGSYVEALNVAGRMVLCNMAVEMGAKTAYMQPNQAVLDYVSARTDIPFEVMTTDADYKFNDSRTFDISELEPQVAIPGNVDDVTPVDAVLGVKVHQGFIGACTGGRTEDIAAAATVLKGKKIADSCRLIVIPASSEVFLECMEKGYVEELVKAGATFSTPGCGPCLAAHEGVLAPGEVCITASNRNFPGRMGSNQSEIYLASPAVVAASMLKGCIARPQGIREVKA